MMSASLRDRYFLLRSYLVIMVPMLMKSPFEYVCKLPPGKKIPSEMEVAPRYTLLIMFTMLTLLALLPLFDTVFTVYC